MSGRDTSQARWVLAFDASCGTCRKISGAVADACNGRLEVLPLTHPDVEQWREHGLGSGAAWVPTLIKVQANEVRAWTGTAMGIALVRHLGPRSTVGVLEALGRQRRARNTRTSDQTRKSQKVGPVLQMGAGLAVAVSLMMMRPPSAGGGPEGGEDPHAWVEANKDRLPQSYEQIITHATPYRSAILGALPAATRGQLWVEHTNHYRAAHHDLSEGQVEVIDRVVDIIPKFFASRQDHRGEAQRLAETAKQAFGHEEARALLTTFGPPDSEPVAAARGLCSCATTDDWCGSGRNCEAGGCRKDPNSCGWWGTETCNGHCGG